ncbi:MAG: hypothetical protein KatS3mg022_1990 [Armatimonadota bacterium]|nr:MAG: hypothetical protein KatS3mg022_1990 [Armatimonadota bacterium]
MLPFIRFRLWLARFRTPYRIAMFAGGYVVLNLLIRGLGQHIERVHWLKPLLWTILIAFWMAVLYLLVCRIVLDSLVRRTWERHSKHPF